MGFVRICQLTVGPGLARQPGNRGMVHGHRLGNRSAAFAGGQALESLDLLMVGELRFAAEARAFVLGGAAGQVQMRLVQQSGSGQNHFWLST
jgi:hypothetical protein